MADTKMVSEHRVLSPKQKGKESGVVDSEVKKEKNRKETRKVVEEKNDRHSVSEAEASVPMRRPKISIEKCVRRRAYELLDGCNVRCAA